MKHLFVPFNLAEALEKKEFNEECLKYCITKYIYPFRPGDLRDEALKGVTIKAPLYQQVIDWFREKHGIWVNADLLPNIKKYAPTFVPLSMTPKDYKNSWDYHVARRKYSTNDRFEDYYKCLDKAIEEALKLIP